LPREFNNFTGWKETGLRFISNDMKEDQHRFLSLAGRLPARLTAEQVAWVLNCQPHDVPILVASRLLKPLGNPAPNGIKFFASSDILEQANDRAWLGKMSNLITQYWKKKNIAGKKGLGILEPIASDDFIPNSMQANRTLQRGLHTTATSSDFKI
jgi:hypothetical protein